MSTSNQYNSYYYQHGCGKPYERNEEWLDFFGGIAERIKSTINPETVLDAGCAMGFLVEKLRENSIQAFGVDISEFAIEKVHESIRPYCWLGSITEPFPENYDLIVTIEVFEHIPRNDAELAVENLCRHTNDVLFSSSPYDFTEVTHLNVQPTDYWAELFAKQGFYRDVDFDASFLTYWAVRFRRSVDPFPRIIKNYERVMHRLVEENISLRKSNLDQNKLLSFKENQLDVMDQQYKKDVLNQQIELDLKNQQIDLITSGLTYRIASKLRGLVPVGSFREKMVLPLLRYFKLIE